MANVTASYSPKHFLVKVIIRPSPGHNMILLTGPGIYPQNLS